MPVTPTVTVPGLARASAASSGAELTFIAAFTTSMVELNAAMPTGAKSFSGSYGRSWRSPGLIATAPTVVKNSV